MQVDITKKNGNKYLIFDDSVNGEKGLLRKYIELWDGIKNKIKAIIVGQKFSYKKDYMQIKFNLGNDLPLNKSLNFHAVAITVRSVFEKDDELYPQFYVDDLFYLVFV